MLEFLKDLFVSATNYCVPGPDCHPDWTAWGALITFLAVLVPAWQHEQDRRDQRLEKIRKGHAAIRQFAYDTVDLGGQIKSHRAYLPHMVQMLREVGPGRLSEILRLRASLPQFDPIKEFDQISYAMTNLAIAMKAFNQLVELGGTAHMEEPEHHIFARTDLMERMLKEVADALYRVIHSMEVTLPSSTDNVPKDF